MRAVASRFIPLVPLRGLIAFPHEVYPIFIGRPTSINAIDAAISLSTNSPILLVAQRDSSVADPSAADMYKVGTLAIVVRRIGLPDGTVKVLAEGKKRARVARFVFGQKFFKAQAEEITETADGSAELEKLKRSVLTAFNSYALRHTKFSPELATYIEAIDDPSILSDKMVGHLNIQLAEQQALLESANPIERLNTILGYLEAAN
jgi:ATP-dependent Lon protease